MTDPSIKGRLSELFCDVLYATVVHSDTHTHTHEQFFQLTVGLGFFRFRFVCVLFAFVEVTLVSSVLTT